MGLPHMETSYQRGRGKEPVVVEGRMRLWVAVNIVGLSFGYWRVGLTENIVQCERVRSMLYRGNLWDSFGPMKYPFKLIAAILVSAVLGLAWWFVAGPQPLRELDHLAQVTASSRTLDLRTVGAPYVAPRAQNGRDDESVELLKVEANVEQQLERSPNEPRWLHAKGRVLVVRQKPDLAISALQAAGDLGLDEPTFWVDFASAYYARAEQNGTSIDYSKAVELISRALRQRPGDPVVLYNRGWMFWKLHLYGAAVRDMQSCLRVERSPEWREQTTKTVDIWQRQLNTVTTPGMADATAAEADLDQAWRKSSWGGKGEALAQKMLSDHGDVWLAELLAHSIAKDLASGLWALAESRTRLDVERSHSYLNRVERLDRGGLGAPIRIWVEFERLFASSHSANVSGCLSLAGFVQEAIQRRYFWFAVQGLLERSTCETALGDLDAADRSTAQALKMARATGFRWATARASGFQISHWVNEGRYREAMDMAAMTIETIFAERLPVRMTHQAFLEMTITADAMERWNTAAAAAEMAAVVAHTAEFRKPEVFALSRRVAYLRRAGETSSELATATAAANTVVAGMRGNASFAIESSMARLDLNTDLSEIRQVGETLEAERNLFIELPYRLARAKAELQFGSKEEGARQAQIVLERIRLAGDDARKFRSEQEMAVRLSVETALVRGDSDGALSLWEQFLASDWRLLGGVSEGVGSNQTEYRITVADLESRLAIWLDGHGLRRQFKWASLDTESCRALVRRLRRLCADSRSNPREIDSTTRKLRAALLGGWENQIPDGATVRLRARGELASMPTLLLFGDRIRGFLSPGSGAYAACLIDGERAVAIRATVSSPDWRGVLPLLRNLAPETNVAIESFSKPMLIEGQAATPKALDRAMRGAASVHFAGHSLQWKNRIHLVVAPDATETDEARRLGLWTFAPEKRLCVNQLVLLACSTAAFVDSESVLPGQLAEAALVSGVRNVIAAAWDIDTVVSSKFAVSYYRLLAAGLKREDAIVGAALELRSHPEYSHPYYWAGFQLFRL